jgi:ketosteroid isomerase-like protein
LPRAVKASFAVGIAPTPGAGFPPLYVSAVSAENVEIVRRAFEPWQAGDLEAFARFVAPDIEWDISEYQLPDFPDTGIGRAAFLGHMADYVGGWVDYRPAGLELTAMGEHVIAMTHEYARMRDTDVEIDREVAVVWTVRDGVFTRFRIFRTREDAIDALG